MEARGAPSEVVERLHTAPGAINDDQALIGRLFNLGVCRALWKLGAHWKLTLSHLKYLMQALKVLLLT